MRAAFALLAAVLAGCGRTGDPVPQLRRQFAELARAHGRYVDAGSIAIEVADLGGALERIDCAGHRVVIDRHRWDDVRDGAREAAVFHVLAHCLLGRGHRDGMQSTESTIHAPISLMHPEFVSGQIYLSIVDKYREELFSAPFIFDTVFP